MVQTTRLLVAEIPEAAGRELEIETGILGPSVEVRRWNGVERDRELVLELQKADVVLTDFVKIDSELMNCLRPGALISVAATG